MNNPYKRAARELISINDIAITSGMPFLVVIALIMKDTGWTALAHRVSGGASQLVSRSQKDLIQRITEISAHKLLKTTAETVALKIVANEIITTLQIIRNNLPGNWRPNIDVKGVEHLKTALNNGKGAILWDSHFYGASLVTKMGLHRLGYQLYHLSREEHGFSSTRFGIRFVNPMRINGENRYLAERIVISDQNPGRALEQLAEKLAENKIINITVRSEANRPINVPFFNGTVNIAPGAPVLAWNTNATLIPIFTTKIDAGHYCVRLDTPINTKDFLSRNDAVTAAANEYVRRLETIVLQVPEQWIEWINI